MATTDPTHDVLRDARVSLDPLFAPRSVAVIGASERAGSVGRTLLWNLISNPFGGAVFPVNAKASHVLGIKAYPNIAAVPDHVDLAVIATPAPTVPGIVRECAAAGVRGAIVISAGFKEIGPEGVKLEREVLEHARAGRMRIIGPNCLGVMRPSSGLNATFAGAMARTGNVAFLSQSGALLTAILDWSIRESVGFSAFVSLGSMLDVSWGDLIDYLGDDPHTRSILLYMESIGDARSFLSAAREVALRKPIIVIKAGRTEAAAKAAASHTGTLAGSDEVLSTAFRRAGVLRVDSIDDLFHMAEALARQPRPSGRRLAIVTNAGGPGVLATDSLIEGSGQLAPLSPATIGALNGFLPPQWSHANPVDILGDADPERYARALEVVGRDENADGLLVVLTPQDMTDPTQTAERLKGSVRIEGKPVLASWMGGAAISAGEQILNAAGVPTFPYPDTAARIFNFMWRHADALEALYQTPAAAEEPAPSARERGSAIVEAARREGRALLTEAESKQLLAAYGIPTVETRVATTADAAAREADALGYPVVVKLHSKEITHKSDVGGVKLDLRDASAVRAAFESIREKLASLGKAAAFEGVTVQPMVKREGYELILGSSLDPQFGPVLLVGSGGTLVEVYKDRALGLPPLNTTLARRLVERTKIFRALQGIRGQPPVDLARLDQLLVRFSQLVVEQRFIKELDINPLLASAERFVALDARVVLHPPGTAERDLPRLAIRPYPAQYAGKWTMKNGEEVTVRPIRPEDEPAMMRFHSDLSEQSVYLRYAGMLQLGQRVAHERLARLCFIDYDREMALVAERRAAPSAAPQLLAVARLVRRPFTGDGEFALLVSDSAQRQGLGTELLARLIAFGKAEGFARIIGYILPQNAGMQRVCLKLGFELSPAEPGGTVKAVKLLSGS